MALQGANGHFLHMYGLDEAAVAAVQSAEQILDRKRARLLYDAAAAVVAEFFEQLYAHYLAVSLEPVPLIVKLS